MVCSSVYMMFNQSAALKAFRVNMRGLMRCMIK